MTTLSLTEEQQLLQKSAVRLFAERSPPGRVRKLRGDATGFSWELWRELAGLGWVGAHVPGEYGGSGLGFFELCLILESAGRTLTPEPFVSAALCATELLLLGGSEPQKSRWLSAIAAGEAVATVAEQERGSRYEFRKIATRATAEGDGHRLSGEKVQVLDAHVASLLIVPALTTASGGISLFLVDPRAGGVRIERQTRIDGRNAAIVVLHSVRVESGDVLGPLNEGATLLERMLERAAIGLSAEMLGAASRAFELTLEYLKSREQFGVKIGSFQALQHRAARLFIELELARSAVLAAARAVDSAPHEVPLLSALAKAACSDVFVHAANEGVQMHGGIGMTDEHDIGLYLKRARAADATFGDAAWHRARWASLLGY
jgi:alkylation response protein AidB-like acyl-CoA dehydrogenase